MLQRSLDTARYAAGDKDSSSLRIQEVAWFFREYWRTIVLTILLFVGVAVLYCLNSPNAYTASTRVLVNPPKIQLFNEDMGTQGGPGIPVVDSQVEVFFAENILLPVIDELKLTQDPEFTRGGGLRASIMGLFRDPSPPTEHELRRKTVAALTNRLDVRKVGTTYMVEVAFTSADPEKAATITNAIANGYLREQLNAKAEMSRRGSEWLEQRTNDLRKQMVASNRAMLEFKTQQSIAGNAQARSTLSELEAFAKTQQQVYETFLQKYNEALQQETFPIPDARIMTVATPPVDPSWPKPALTVALALAAGSVVGIGLGVLRRGLNHTVNSRGQVRRELGLDCLGQVPALPPIPRAGFPALSRSRRRLRRLSAERQRFKYVLRAPDSAFANSLRTAKTFVDLLAQRESLRCVGIISALPNEGKSLLASNLAHLFAGAGSHTLLIDGDMHNSTLSELLASSARVGLREVIENYSTTRAAVVQHIAPNLDFLPVVSAPDGRHMSPSDLLASEGAKNLFQLARNSYELVLIDLPPWMARPDAQAVSPMLDAYIVVVECGRTPIELVDEVVQSVGAAARVLGVVINKTDPKRHGQYSSYYPVP